MPELSLVLRGVGLALCGAGLLLCLVLSRVRLSAVGCYKLLAVFALAALPAAAVGVGNYQVFEGVKDASFCNQCHVMRPVVSDLRDPQSQTLAARHHRNRWIPQEQCFACHTGDGQSGTLRATMDGYRHLARYTTGSYSEPIRFRGTYDNARCLKCHAGTPAYVGVSSHRALAERLQRSAVRCVDCHGPAHPDRPPRHQ